MFPESEKIYIDDYVDNNICLFNCESDGEIFLDMQHSNIKFTFDKQVKNQISFLESQMMEINFGLLFSAKKL